MPKAPTYPTLDQAIAAIGHGPLQRAGPVCGNYDGTVTSYTTCECCQELAVENRTRQGSPIRARFTLHHWRIAPGQDGETAEYQTCSTAEYHFGWNRLH